MKRWLLSVVFVALAACPAMALAGTMVRPEFVRPIARPVFKPPATITGTGFGFYSAPYGAEDLRGAQYLGPAHLGLMNINVAMQMRDEAGLQRYALLASSPHSLYYRRFLTPQQVGYFFGASSDDYARAVGYFSSQGLAVRSWAQREMVRVVGPQQEMERAFGTHFGLYRKNGVTFYAPASQPHFSSALAVRGIGGMVTYRHFRRHFDVGGAFTPYQGAGPGLGIGNSPFELAAAFDYTGAYNLTGTCCKGDGITIGIVGTGPISAFDVPAFRQQFNSLAGATGTVSQINVTAVMPCCYSRPLGVPPPVTAPCTQTNPPNFNVCNPEDFEAQLDTEQTSSLAPNASVLFYLAFNPHECFTPGPCSAGVQALGIGETDDELQQIANDDNADVVSGSFGIGELDFASSSNPLLTCPAATPSGCSGADPAIFATMAAEGMAVFISSGDTGASGCQRDGGPNIDKLCVSYPSGDVSVVSVGGTTTPIGSNGRLTGLVTTWGVQTQTFGGSGGGFSSVLKRPAYEPVGSFCAAPPNGSTCDSTHRLQPDLSFNSDPATGDTIIVNCGSAPPGCGGLGGAQIGSIGGTSAAAPDMAAMWALVLEACKQTTSCATHSWTGTPHLYRLGNPAPLLYALNASQRASIFYDVVYGVNAVPTSGMTYPNVNAGFSARTGFDLATGLGVPSTRNLIKAVVGI